MMAVNVAAAKAKFVFGTCKCTLDSVAGTGDISFALRMLHVSGHAHVRLHVSMGRDNFMMQLKAA